MDKIYLSLLRGVCQIPAYMAVEAGHFAQEGLEAVVSIEPTAWMVPQKLGSGEAQFAVIPWTRAVAANQKSRRLVVVTGSGINEAAIVVRTGLNVSDVESISIPMRGGMKDLTARGLMKSLGWDDIEILRQPSGDGAIIAFFGDGVDAASMVEPYATMLVRQGRGHIARRTGDIWPGAPGCSLTVSEELRVKRPELIRRVVQAYRRAANHVTAAPREAAEVARRYIGVSVEHIVNAIEINPPCTDAIRNKHVMNEIIALMKRLGYLENDPQGYYDLSFLDIAEAAE